LLIDDIIRLYYNIGFFYFVRFFVALKGRRRDFTQQAYRYGQLIFNKFFSEPSGQFVT